MWEIVWLREPVDLTDYNESKAEFNKFEGWRERAEIAKGSSVLERNP